MLSSIYFLSSFRSKNTLVFTSASRYLPWRVSCSCSGRANYDATTIYIPHIRRWKLNSRYSVSIQIYYWFKTTFEIAFFTSSYSPTYLFPLSKVNCHPQTVKFHSHQQQSKISLSCTWKQKRSEDCFLSDTQSNCFF